MHYHAFQQCQPSHFVLLALLTPKKGESMILVRNTSAQTRRRKHCRSTVILISPEHVTLIFLLPFNVFSRYPCRHLLNQHSLVYVSFSNRSSLPSLPHRVENSSGVSGAILSLPLLPGSFSTPPVPGLWSPSYCDGLAGVSGLAAVAAVYSLSSLLRYFANCVFRPTSGITS